MLIIFLQLGLLLHPLGLSAQRCVADSLAVSQLPAGSVDSSGNKFCHTADSIQSYPDRVRFDSRQFTVPAIFMGTGIAMDLTNGIKNSQLTFHDNHLGGFHSAADNILLYVPAALPYGMDLLGIRSKTDIANRTAILIKAEILVTASGYLLKHTVHEWRPDRSNQYSFPSGHSLQVFATATMLSEEYRDRFKWMPYVAYGLATGVGLLRLANNRHYVGDVLFGAGLGILSMKLAYWTHHYKWHKNHPFK